MKVIQDNLPGCDCEIAETDAKNREREIPPEVTNAYLNKMHWKFRKYADKCKKNIEQNMKRAQDVVFLVYGCRQNY